MSASLFLQDRPGGRPTPWAPGLICGPGSNQTSG